MTQKEYNESRERAKKMCELYEADPEEGRRQALASFEPLVNKINKYLAKEKRTNKKEL